MSRYKKKYKVYLLLLALPSVCFVLIFCYLPLFGWSYAFMDYRPGTPFLQQTFVGLKYFNMLFTDSGSFLNAILNTLGMSFLIILVTPVPVIFAIMLSKLRSSKFSRFVQTVSSLPYFVSFILIYFLFFVILSSQDGVINRFLMNLHLISTPTNLLGNSNLAWLTQTIVFLFKNVGYTAIIYIAAISGIDPELYDAASVDGAGEFRQIIHVTLPGIAATYFVMLLLTFAGMLTGAGFEQYYVFQNPLVLNRIDVLDTYVYRRGITLNEYAYATAVGIFKSVISIILLFTFNGMSKIFVKRSLF